MTETSSRAGAERRRRVRASPRGERQGRRAAGGGGHWPVAEYGGFIPDLADTVRSSVAQAVEPMCGMGTTEVNITVADVHLPEDDDG